MENEYKVEDTDLGTRTFHPAYGTLLFNKSSCGSTSLFGSSIKHRNVITMELYHANISRELNKDWIFGNKPIVKVKMSYSQFAEAITSFGMNTGVPVTITWTEKDGNIPECDFISKQEQFVDEFTEKRKESVKESRQIIQDVKELFSQKKTLTKADKQEIINRLNRLSMNIGSNLDFVAKSFTEQIDKTVMEAKGEIEAFYQNKISSIAHAAIMEQKEDMLRLENPVDIDE